MSKTTAYYNHIKNSDLETREFFERETENIIQTRQTDLVTTLNDNLLTRSADSSTNEEIYEPEVNPNPEPSSLDSSSETSSSDSRIKKKKHKKKKKRRKHQKNDSSDPSSSNNSDSSNDINYGRKHAKRKTPGKESDQTMCNFNGKVADDSVKIKYHQVSNG